MKEINLAVIGSGSTYCPELIDGFIQARESLRLKRVIFMDIDERKRRIVGNLCIRMLEQAGFACETLQTDDLDETLRGADFVLTQFRVGKLSARHLDETIPLRHGLIGQETTGIGGFFKALRSIPVMRTICARMETLCPEAWLINFSNPSGILTEYILNETKIKGIGLCNMPILMEDQIRAVAGADSEISYVGLNHLSWVTHIMQDGRDLLPNLLQGGLPETAKQAIQDEGFSLECLASVGAIPSSYLQYYYNRQAKLKELRRAEKSRAQVCMEIEEQLLELYADEDLTEKPALLDKRGGYKYSLAAVSLIDAIANDRRSMHIVNIKNNGALPFMEADDVVEIAAVVGRDGAVPVPFMQPVSPHIMSLMRIVKAYEKYALHAAVEGSDEAAYNAMLLHPLIGDWEQAAACYAELKEAHAAYLPQFS